MDLSKLIHGFILFAHENIPYGRVALIVPASLPAGLGGNWEFERIFEKILGKLRGNNSEWSHPYTLDFYNLLHT